MSHLDPHKHEKSLLPAGKKWKLVWHDEFDGDRLDLSKWSFRLHLMQHRHQTFSEDGAMLDGKGNLLMTPVKQNGHFFTSQLQTGENFMDRPPEGHLPGHRYRWPLGKLSRPKFAHRYGYYECRCKLPTQPGWWVAFWLQSPINGSTLDPALSGVEMDIMENFSRDGVVSHNNHWNGCGVDYRGAGSGPRQLQDTPDGFHVFGLDWSPEGYVYYIDGEESWRGADSPVSEQEQFILISAECMGYRKGTTPAAELQSAKLPDYFVVNYVRVYDEVRA